MSTKLLKGAALLAVLATSTHQAMAVAVPARLPDTGATALLLGAAVAGLAMLRHSRTKK